jgi:parvulin-like peptidyl-prolyl isomerase
MWRSRALIISTSAALTAAGCANTSAPPLRPEAFISRPGSESGMVTSQTDANGALVYGQLHAPLLPEEYNEFRPLPPTAPPISVVRAQSPDTRPSSDDSASPTSFPASQASSPGVVSNYQVVGTVIAIVNGTPIYADKILAALDQQLAADARRMTPQEFQLSAGKKIQDRVYATIQDQQYLAAANEYLTPESKTNADRFGIMWKIQQIQAANGSIEEARDKALRETGLTLEELAQNTRDQVLVQIFLDQKIKPLIQVTASDQRQYYEQHIKDFTQTAEAKFRLIKIDVAKRGGPEEAARVINTVIEKLRARTPFEQVSKLYNNDPNDGIVAGGNWVQKGSYVNDEVENAVWKLTPGEFTDPPIRVNEQNAFYIAYLDAKKDGNVQPFEDVAVQAQIKKILEDRQFQALREKVREGLIKQAVLKPVDGWEKNVMDMVMQRYAMWNSSKS